MARKYVNPARPAAGGYVRGDHGPFSGAHRHLHAAFGDEISRDHVHNGDAVHGARAAGDGEGVYGPRAGQPGRIMARASAQRVRAAQRELEERKPAMVLEAERAAEPPGKVLDSYAFSRSWAAYLKAIQADGPERTVIANAWTERVGSEGGYLVPEALRSEVLAYLSAAIVYPRAVVIPAATLRTGMPYLDNPDQSGGQQGLGGIEFAITEPGDEIPSTGPRFGRTALEAHKVAALIEGIPNELLEDASEAVDALLGRIIGLGYAWFVDDLAFNGTGAGEPQGLLYSGAAFAVTRGTSSEVLHSDVTAMAKALHPASKKTATWLASEDVFDYLLDLYETVGTAPTGQQIPPPGSLKFNSQTGQWELLGMAFEVSDHQPQIGTPGDLMLADLSLYVFAERQALTVELSAAGAGFASGTTTARVKGRLDGRYWPSSTYTLRNGRVCSPLVVLQ